MVCDSDLNPRENLHAFKLLFGIRIGGLRCHLPTARCRRRSGAASSRWARYTRRGGHHGMGATAATPSPCPRAAPTNTCHPPSRSTACEQRHLMAVDTGRPGYISMPCDRCVVCWRRASRWGICGVYVCLSSKRAPCSGRNGHTEWQDVSLCPPSPPALSRCRDYRHVTARESAFRSEKRGRPAVGP